MRILVYNWRDLDHPRSGGAEVYTDHVTREWVGMGHEVTLFTSRPDGSACEEQRNGVRIVRRGGRLGVYREAQKFYQRHGRGHFDLVVDEVNTRPFGTPKWVKDAPVVALIHQVCREIWFYEAPLPVALLGRYVLEPWWLKAYRDVPVVTVSESSRRSLHQYGLRNVVVVPEGYDPVGATGELPPKEKTPTLVFVGRLSANKRPDHAIEAFGLVRHKLPDARLWVIGTGPMENRLRRKAPDGVAFLGHVTETEKRDRLARAHALICTSVREGWGLVVTEAAALRTPAIGYDVPGLSDSIRASGGTLVEPGVSELAIAVESQLVKWTLVPPVVAPAGVIPWGDVARQVIFVAGLGEATPGGERVLIDHAQPAESLARTEESRS